MRSKRSGSQRLKAARCGHRRRANSGRRATAHTPAVRGRRRDQAGRSDAACLSAAGLVAAAPGRLLRVLPFPLPRIERANAHPDIRDPLQQRRRRHDQDGSQRRSGHFGDRHVARAVSARPGDRREGPSVASRRGSAYRGPPRRGRNYLGKRRGDQGAAPLQCRACVRRLAGSCRDPRQARRLCR